MCEMVSLFQYQGNLILLWSSVNKFHKLELRVSGGGRSGEKYGVLTDESSAHGGRDRNDPPSSTANMI